MQSYGCSKRTSIHYSFILTIAVRKYAGEERRVQKIFTFTEAF